MERATHVLRRMRATSPSPTETVTVVAVEGERDLRELLPQFWERKGARPTGAYWAGPFGHHIAVRVDTGREERFRRILHEYTHFVTHLAHPNPPRWLDEGMSELWTNAVLSENAIEIGGAAKNNLKRLRSGNHWIPLAKLLAAQDLPAPDDPKLRMFYAESWALLHYLLFAKGDGRISLDDTASPDRLPTDESLQQYVQHFPSRTVKIPTPPPGQGACNHREEPRALSTLDSLKFRAAALADGARPEAALPLLIDAIALDPNDTQVKEITGFVQFSINQFDAAAATLDKAIASGRASHIAYYYRAILADPPAAQYLHKALDINPGFTPARERLRELASPAPESEVLR